MTRRTIHTLLTSASVLVVGAAVGGAALRTDPAPLVAPAALVPAAIAPALPAVMEEGRALWVNRWDYGNEETIKQVMRNAQRAHFNIVYFQVRGPSDARYRSQLDPCSPRLCGRLGGVPTWDPLEVAVREAHSRGLQLHAWINALSGWESQKQSECDGLVRSAPGQPNHVLIDHPDWAMHTRRGNPQRCPNGEEYVYLSPGNPEVRTHLARVAADVVRRYDVDGVHLDRIRYPGNDFGWDRATIAAFGRDPASDREGWSRFRRELVTKTVQETHDSINAVRHVPLSAAVWPIYDRTRFGWPSSSGVSEFFQDTWGWASQGYLDVAVPMTYFYVANEECSYRPRRPGQEPNPDWTCMVTDHVKGMKPTGRHVYAAVLTGLPFPEIERQVRIGRERGVNGFGFYSYGALAEVNGFSFLANGPFREPAVVPRMDWIE